MIDQLALLFNTISLNNINIYNYNFYNSKP